MDINTVFWVAANYAGLVVFIASGLFTILYIIFWNPRVTTAGWLIWSAFLAITLFGLNQVLGVWVDGRTSVYELPTDVAWWRPVVRLIAMGVVAYTFARLVTFVVVRRFWPDRVKIAPPEEHTLEPRRRR